MKDVINDFRQLPFTGSTKGTYVGKTNILISLDRINL